MVGPSIIAEPDTIVVDLDSGQISGVTGVVYNSAGFSRIVLWERLLGITNSKWVKIDLLRGRVQNTGPTTLQEGKFTSQPVQPGQCYQVRMDAELNNDPNIQDIPPVASVNVCALRKRPDGRDFLIPNDSFEETGGTYRFQHAATKVLTHQTVSVSKDPPFEDSNGMLAFNKTERFAEGEFAVGHDAELSPLSPGTRYFCLTRLSDQTGNWQFISKEFLTLQRKVTIRFNKLHIDNDGDTLSNGEAQFFIRVKQGVGLRIIQPEIVFGNDSFSIHDGQDLDITTHVFVLGPEDVTLHNELIGIDLFGVEFDGFLESNEYAGGFGRLILPTGRAEEKPGGIRRPVTKGRKVVAFPQNLATFSFTQNYDVTTEYV
jgi:hypothetical protein